VARAETVLSRSTAGGLRVAVEQLVAAGRVEQATALVDDELTLAALQIDIQHHIASCPACSMPALYFDSNVACSEIVRMERREFALLDLICRQYKEADNV
jgi:hypothetical protein